MLLAQAVLISVDELLDFRSAASIFTSQRRMSLGLHRFARTSPGHSMKCPKPVRNAGSLQRCQQYWFHFMRRELFTVHQRTCSTRRAKTSFKRKTKTFSKTSRSARVVVVLLGMECACSQRREIAATIIGAEQDAEKAPVVRRMRTGSAGSWPAGGPWPITGGEAATTTYLSSRAETKC